MHVNSERRRRRALGRRIAAAMGFTPMRTIRAAVFDLGEVLIEWDPRNLYRKMFGGDEEAMERFLATVCTADWNAKQDRAGRSPRRSPSSSPVRPTIGVLP
jgi:hypothetical protein